MASLLTELVRLLSREPLTVAEVVAKIGSIRSDPGPPLDIDLESKVDGIRGARISRYPDTGELYILELELVDPIPVASLRAAFGEFRQTRTDRGHPRSIIFFPPSTEPHWKVAVIAEIPPGATPIDDEAAGTIA